MEKSTSTALTPTPPYFSSGPPSSTFEKIKQYFSVNNFFIDVQIVSSILLIISASIAIIWATVPSTYDAYLAFIYHKVGFLWGEVQLTMTVQEVVNDILLTLFFFVVGLEIKREALVGELSNYCAARSIIVSAMGGIIVPAAIYLMLTWNTAFASGWAIPTATDTAFVIGVLALFRRHLKPVVFIVLAALAVVDDIAGIIFIGVFYSDNIIPLYLLYAACTYSLILLLNRYKVHHVWPYLLLGLVLWALIEHAGVHGTIAGIFTALAIPAKSKLNVNFFVAKLKKLLQDIKLSAALEDNILKDLKQHQNLEKLEQTVKQTTTPLVRWESKLELPVLLLVLPLFALTNAGIHINLGLFHNVSDHLLATAIVVSLVIGKPCGIISFAYLAQRLQLGHLPGDCRLHDIIGPAILAGMGFTMSLFITDLNFSGDELHLEIAKLAIVIASLTSAILGCIWIAKFQPKSE